MTESEARLPEALTSALIAPCGMNCGLCIGHLREKKRCPGCNGDDANKPRHCAVCQIRNCEALAAAEQGFCLECATFPCVRLRRLDKRYRTKYGMSMIENLESIRDIGLEEFVAREKQRWTCPECGSVICVHRESCIVCGRARSQTPAGE